jgi:hypothetical protein
VFKPKSRGAPSKRSKRERDLSAYFGRRKRRHQPADEAEGSSPPSFTHRIGGKFGPHAGVERPNGRSDTHGMCSSSHMKVFART